MNTRQTGCTQSHDYIEALHRKTTNTKNPFHTHTLISLLVSRFQCQEEFVKCQFLAGFWPPALGNSSNALLVHRHQDLADQQNWGERSKDVFKWFFGWVHLLLYVCVRQIVWFLCLSVSTSVPAGIAFAWRWKHEWCIIMQSKAVNLPHLQNWLLLRTSCQSRLLGSPYSPFTFV